MWWCKEERDKFKKLKILLLIFCTKILIILLIANSYDNNKCMDWSKIDEYWIQLMLMAFGADLAAS